MTNSMKTSYLYEKFSIIMFTYFLLRIEKLLLSHYSIILNKSIINDMNTDFSAWTPIIFILMICPKFCDFLLKQI